MRLTPSGAAVGSEFHVDVSAAASEALTIVSDVVRARATARDMLLTLSQNSAVVGNVVVARLTFRNPLDTTLRNLKAEIGTGAEGVPTNDVAPPSVASLPPGSVAQFTRPFVMAREGQIEFTGRIQADRADGSTYEGPNAMKRLTNGILRLVASDFVQVIPHVPLVKYKPTVIGLTISNSTSFLQPMELSVDLDTDFTPDQKDSFHLVIPSIPGRIGPAVNDVSVRTHTNEAVRLKFIPDWAGNLKLKLFPSTSAWFPAYAGQTLETNYTSQDAVRLDYRFSRLAFDPSYHIPQVSAADAALLEKADGPFLVACYPTEPHEPRLPLTTVQVTKGVLPSPNWARLMRLAERSAVSAGVDGMVVVFPKYAPIWPSIPGIGDAAGWAFRAPAPIKHVVSIVDTNVRFVGTQSSVSAHEIGHTFGFPDVPHPTSTSVPVALWVERDKVSEDVYDLMDYAEPNWINEAHYRALLAEFSKVLLDPDVILVSGEISQDGQVTADPWYSMKAAEASESAEVGTHAVELWDADGRSLARFPFTPGFVAEAYPVTLPADVQDTSLTLDAAPFVFAIPKPAGVSRITIATGDQVLLERIVSAHSPEATVLSPKAGIVFAAGDAVPVNWSASDADGDALFTSIQFSADGGSTWHGVAMDVSGGESSFEAPDLSTAQAVVKVQVTDGVNTTEAVSPRFRIQGSVSKLVASAGPSRTVTVGESVVLDGSGSHDPAGGTVRLAWRIGAEPEGAPTTLNDPATDHPSFTPLKEGRYGLRVLVTSGDQSAVATTTVVATAATAPQLRVALSGESTVELRWAASAAGYHLLTSPSVAGPTGWSAVDGAPSAEGADLVVRIPLEPGGAFFRLAK